MQDHQRSVSDYDKYKHIATGLFSLSKKFGCAVVVCMQANRATKENKDDKGIPMPSLYEIEGSDHPARICTQAITLRQIFETHVLDIRLEKARMANNQNPVFSYSWDINTGNMQFIPGGDSESSASNSAPAPAAPVAGPILQATKGPADDISLDDDDDDVEF